MITVFSLIILLFSVVIHEVSHGAIANHLGDSTAKYSGRLTLNPLRHLDPFGSIILPLLLFAFQSPVLFGWAKPVPVNPLNLKDRRWGMAKVGIAGPGSNILIAVVFGLILRFFLLPAAFLPLFDIIIILNLVLAIFNLIPIPPLDGSRILFALLPDRFWQTKMFLEQYGMLILLFFIFFGLRWIFPLMIWSYYLIVGRLPILF